MRRPILGGFTLLEVMVAVAILGLALTAIFSSQAGAIRTGARARSMSIATLLARCKMGEVEEQMMREGFPAVHAEGSDRCCEGGEVDHFECDWSVVQITLPDTMDMGEEDPLAAAAGAAGATPAGAPPALGDALGGGGDMIGAFAMQYAFPLLRPAIESQVRRATVTVRWREGSAERSFDVVQFLVMDQGTSMPGQDPNQTGQPGLPGQPGQPGQPGLPFGLGNSSIPRLPVTR